MSKQRKGQPQTDEQALERCFFQGCRCAHLTPPNHCQIFNHRVTVKLRNDCFYAGYAKWTYPDDRDTAPVSTLVNSDGRQTHITNADTHGRRRSRRHRGAE